jgi:N utilization substance protein A
MIAPQHFEDEIRKAFGKYVPEVLSGVLEFKKIAREPGKRTYIAVSAAPIINDPIGLLVGKRGIHIKAVIADLGGEYFTVVRWQSEPREFIANNLNVGHPGLPFDSNFRFDASSRQVLVTVDKETQERFTSDDGLNLRLVSELVGWDITLVCQDKSSNE